MQAKTYKPRVEVQLVPIAVLVLVLVAVLIFAPKDVVLPFSGILLMCLFSMNMKYVIDGDTLKIYINYWMHKDVDIKSIRKIEPSKCSFCSFGTSGNRLAIHYNKYDVVYVSPRDKEDFINEINKRREENVEIKA